MSVLVIAEHDNAQLKGATRNVVAAAARIGGDIHVLVAGANARAAADDEDVDFGGERIAGESDDEEDDLNPAPTTTDCPSGANSARIPEIFSPSTKTSLGHFKLTFAS